MRLTPRLLKFLLNLYPPYIGAGVRVDRISDDWREIDVSMRLRWYNRNAVGSHFGGSLYSMLDPQYMLMLMQLLGREYIVWDKSAKIDFLRPGYGKVTAQFRIADAQLEAITEATAQGDKCLPVFELALTDEQGEVVARIEKTLYVRRKPAHR